MSHLTRLSLTLLFALAIVTPLPQAAAAQPPNSALSHVGSMPVRGMSMTEVEQHFGKPIKKSAPVGKPPISQWHYDGFVVYFEYSHVIHALATDD